ncbi:MAG: DIP1984 family protein [Lachnospiraceae bacterium]|nr:DIP1984 family protein [Lachnospiraceae bacterium]
MKLATALTERADLQRRLSELETRLNNNAKIQEGEQPAEDPTSLLAELDGIVLRLEELIAAINLTNSTTMSDGRTLTELLAHRDCVKQRLQIMRSFLDNASRKIDRYSRTEIRIESTVSVSDLQKDVDRISKELREVDEKIQELNWTTELKESETA